MVSFWKMLFSKEGKECCKVVIEEIKTASVKTESSREGEKR